MRNIFLVILVFIGLGLSAQNSNQISCFADIKFVHDNILVKMGHSNPYPSMQPKYLYKNMVIGQTNYGSGHLNQSDINADIERIKSTIQLTEVSSLNADEQDELLRQIALSLIWNKQINLDADIIQSQINEMEFYASGKNKENLHLIINLYHQVYGGE